MEFWDCCPFRININLYKFTSKLELMLFSKKEKRRKLPDLPARGSRASFDAPAPEDEREHPLPAFPDSPTHNEFSQAAIKDAIGAHEDEEYHENEEGEFHPSHPPRDSGDEEKVGEKEENNIKIVEMEEWHPSVQNEEHEEHHGIPPPRSAHRNLPPPRSVSPPSVMSHAPPVAARRPEKKASDVFVKIDKYNSAKRAMGDVKMKLAEIDELIKKIRETKMREEQEIVAWEKDMENIKARMKDITENIFEKID